MISSKNWSWNGFCRWWNRAGKRNKSDLNHKDEQNDVRAQEKAVAIIHQCNRQKAEGFMNSSFRFIDGGESVKWMLQEGSVLSQLFDLETVSSVSAMRCRQFLKRSSSLGHVSFSPFQGQWIHQSSPSSVPFLHTRNHFSKQSDNFIGM
jgi:hypothetical protein